MNESILEYQDALKAGQKEYKACLAAGLTPYVKVLDEAPSYTEGLRQVRIGLVEIPSERIVGTKTAGRQFSFSPSFYPLLEENTEFGAKWKRLCDAHLSDEGIRDPIQCFEFYGKFYVQEGNKRVSVLRHFGARSIPGYVTRILPEESDTKDYKLYREFLDFYAITHVYDVECTVPGFYKALLRSLDCGSERWTESYTKHFLACFQRFRATVRANLTLKDRTPSDALVIFLRYYDFNDAWEMTEEELVKAVLGLQKDMDALNERKPISLSTAPVEPEKENFFSRFVSHGPKHLKIGFIHERDDKTSDWTRAHEIGRKHADELFGDQIETVAYFNAVSGTEGERLIEQAIADGCTVIFTTTPPLIGATLRTAARHPEISMLNCSVNMPYRDIRTYYARIYEGKFITGAIGAAMAKNGRLGYVGSYPIYGVPAAINAFALGAQMIDPDIRIDLQWSCVDEDFLEHYRQAGIDIVSNRDMPTPDRIVSKYGTFRVKPDGTTELLASAYWYWGRMYENIIRSMLDGSWSVERSEAGNRIINYWWGMNSGVIDVVLGDTLPDGVRQLANVLRREMKSGQIHPFLRRIYDQEGILRCDGGNSISSFDLLHIDWLCDCVEGSIPNYDELRPIAKRMVRHLGLHRENLPEEELP